MEMPEAHVMPVSGARYLHEVALGHRIGYRLMSDAGMVLVSGTLPAPTRTGIGFAMWEIPLGEWRGAIRRFALDFPELAESVAGVMAMPFWSNPPGEVVVLSVCIEFDERFGPTLKGVQTVANWVEPLLPASPDRRLSLSRRLSNSLARWAGFGRRRG